MSDRKEGLFWRSGFLRGGECLGRFCRGGGQEAVEEGERELAYRSVFRGAVICSRFWEAERKGGWVAGEAIERRGGFGGLNKNERYMKAILVKYNSQKKE